MNRQTQLRLFFIVLIFAIIFLTPLTALRAQDYVTGAFEGRVTDNTGVAIQGARVQIINKDTGVPVATLTDSDGRFRKNLLPLGDYIIRVSRQDFITKELEQSLPPMRPTSLVPVPVQLQREVAALPTPTPAEAPTTAVAKTEPSPAPVDSSSGESDGGDDIRADINTTDAQRGGAFTEKEVSTLPLGGTSLTRTFDELGLLIPGVALPPQTPGSVSGPGVGAGVGSSGQFAVNGLRSRANNFTVDGSDNNDEDIGVRRQGFLALVPQPIESIQAYQIVALLAPAQYGRNFGGQVNAVSKSGGNEYHGMFFGFLNSSQLNAANPFDATGGNTRIPLQGRVLNPDKQTLGGFRDVYLNCPVNIPAACPQSRVFVSNTAGEKDSLTLGQGGLVFGGPLVPSHAAKPNHGLFFFVSAEGQILNSTREESFAVPTVEERGTFRTGATGLFFDPLLTSRICTPATCFAYPTSFAGDATFSLFPFPNNPQGIYGRNTLTQVLPNSAQGKIISGKVNGNFSFHGKPQEIVARYNFTDDWRDIGVTGGAIFSSVRADVGTQNFSAYLNSPELSDTISNQLRVSYGRTRLNFEELRDTTYLIPSDFAKGLPAGQQGFLLNARTFFNATFPGDTAVFYQSNLVNNVEQNLNPFAPFGTARVPVGQVNVAGFSPVGVDVFNFPQARVNNTYQLADTVSAQLGRDHYLAFGADTRRTELNSDLPRNARPLLTYNALPNVTGIIPDRPYFSGADFAAATAPTGIFQSLSRRDDATINLRYYQLNFFAQDQWRVRRNLYLSVGLRYEYNTVPRSAGKKIENTFGSPIPTAISGLSKFIDGRKGIFDPDRNNFAPRIGIAFAPEIFKNRTTVLRVGGGFFYDQILGAVVSQSRNVFPIFQNVNFAGFSGSGPFTLFTPGLAFVQCAGTTQPVPLIQSGTLNTLNPAVSESCFTNATANTFPAGFPVTLPSRRLDTPMAYQYSGTFEQQISNALVFSAAYVGTQGRHLLRQQTPNLGPNAIAFVKDFFAPDGLGEGQIFGFFGNPGSRYVVSTGTSTGGRPTPNIGGVTLFTSDVNSRYDALQLQLRGRYDFLGATQFQINYAYGEVTDDVSDVFDLAGASALPQNSLTFAGERGPANFDVRHRVTSNYISDFSSWGKKNSFLHAIFNGLEIAGTGTFQTGQPFTINSIFDVNLDGNLTDRLNTTAGIVLTGDRGQPLRLTVPAASLLAPIGQDGKVPRNSFRAGNLWLTNAALIKTISFSESTKLIFRTEVFNLFNRANFGVPVRFLESPGFGRATDTVTPARRIQFGLKLSF